MEWPRNKQGWPVLIVTSATMAAIKEARLDTSQFMVGADRVPVDTGKAGPR